MISSELTNDQIIDLISDYKNFKRIIEASVPEDDRRRNQNRQNRNKDLTKLSNVQFWQLTTDVNDELMKRLTNSGADASLNDLDLKRGKAQSKLSRLKDAKFHKLILDIFTEIERRNLHHLDMGTHNNGLDEGDLNFYLNDTLFESFKINDDFMSVNGIISIEVFRELKTQFTLYFQNTLHRIDPVDTTTTRLPILLETIIKIAKLIGDLLPVLSSVSLQSSLENEIVYLKSALSHAITSTRYFLTYGDLIPRIVAQSSISEVIFAFCNIAQIVKIKSTSRDDISRNEGELSDIEAGMKPLKIIEKVKNEKNGKDISSLGDSGSTAVSFPSSGKPITKKSDVPVVVASPSISIIEKSESSTRESGKVRNNTSGEANLTFVSPLKNTKNSSRITSEPSPRESLPLKVVSNSRSPSPQGNTLPLIGKFRQDYQASPPKKVITKPVAETAKPYANIPPAADVLYSPTVTKMRKFREKVQKFALNSGLGLRISTSEENLNNSDVNSTTHNANINNLVEFVESKSMVVLPMAQGILNDVQASKSKLYKSARSVSRLCQNSIEIIPILESVIDMTTKAMVQKSFKLDLGEHCKEIIERLTDCSQKLSELCTYGCDSTKLGKKRFYQKLADILMEVTKRTRELVECVKMANRQTLS